MFKVLERSIIYPFNNNNEKLEMIVEMLLKIHWESQFYKGVMKMLHM